MEQLGGCRAAERLLKGDGGEMGGGADRRGGGQMEQTVGEVGGQIEEPVGVDGGQIEGVVGGVERTRVRRRGQ